MNMIVTKQKKGVAELYRHGVKAIGIYQEQLPQLCVCFLCEFLLAIEELKCVCCLATQDENLIP